MLKIPKTLKIGAHTFKIVRGGGMTVDDNFGKVCTEKLEMFIRDDVPQSQQEETLLHEAFHVIRELTGLKIRDDENAEELHVQAAAHMLYLFLKDNNLLK